MIISLFYFPSSHDAEIKMFNCVFLLFWKLAVLHVIQSCSRDENILLSFYCFEKTRCSPCHLVVIQWSECSIVFPLFWKNSLFSIASSHDPKIRVFHCLYCFENLTVRQSLIVLIEKSYVWDFWIDLTTRKARGLGLAITESFKLTQPRPFTNRVLSIIPFNQSNSYQASRGNVIWNVISINLGCPKAFPTACMGRFRISEWNRKMCRIREIRSAV